MKNNYDMALTSELAAQGMSYLLSAVCAINDDDFEAYKVRIRPQLDDMTCTNADMTSETLRHYLIRCMKVMLAELGAQQKAPHALSHSPN